MTTEEKNELRAIIDTLKEDRLEYEEDIKSTEKAHPEFAEEYKKNTDYTFYARKQGYYSAITEIHEKLENFFNKHK